jgi:hypothetical protein
MATLTPSEWYAVICRADNADDDPEARDVIVRQYKTRRSAENARVGLAFEHRASVAPDLWTVERIDTRHWG